MYLHITLRLYPQRSTHFVRTAREITDSAANMLKLRENYPIIVCFTYRLNTVVSNSFKKIIKNK